MPRGAPRNGDDGRVIHLRVIVPSDDSQRLISALRSRVGVAHLVVLPAASIVPEGDLLLVDVSREAANDVIEWLQDEGVHHRGAITIEAPEAVVSDAAAAAEEEAPGEGADALIWEQVEARAREEATPTVSYFVFMVVAAVIAVAGILLDSAILVVGAMVVGPDYGPVASACVSLIRRRFASATGALGALVAGLVAGAVGAFVSTALLRATHVAPDSYGLTRHDLAASISDPGVFAVLVALLAGVAGMLALTESRSGVLVGVLVSVTTIPAVANVGVAAAYSEWGRMWGSALQLLVNVLGLLLAGVVTLWLQDRYTVRAARMSGKGRAASSS